MITYADLARKRANSEELLNEGCPAILNPAFPVANFQTCFAVRNHRGINPETCAMCWNQYVPMEVDDIDLTNPGTEDGDSAPSQGDTEGSPGNGQQDSTEDAESASGSTGQSGNDPNEPLRWTMDVKPRSAGRTN